MKCKVKFAVKSSPPGAEVLPVQERRVRFAAKKPSAVRRRAFQAYGEGFAGSDILLVLQVVVPLFQERSQQ